MEPYKILCKPKLSTFLEIMKMDFVYTDASQNYLYTVRNNIRVKILDCVGGYGSTILGHNPDILVGELRAALDDMRPMHAQGSISGPAGKLAHIINSLAKRDLGEGTWITHLVNTGTEATEGALKHALMEWQERRLIAKARKAAPLFIALEGGFHGKTAGSLSVTNSENYGQMYERPAINSLFIGPSASSQQIHDIFAKHTNDSGFCSIAGVVIEVIQGEGGIRPLGYDFVNSVHCACKKYGTMLIVDEVQSGIFRTGTFLATQEYNIVPDCIILGKALGGGMAKIAAVLINNNRYCADFSLVHTSTFAEDDISSLIACKALEHLSSCNIYESSKNFNKTIFQGLSIIDKRYPGVIKEFRGKGFLIGIQFETVINNQMSAFMGCLTYSGLFIFFISSYILNRHNIRTAATINDSQTLRIEPPMTITEAETTKLLLALEDAIGLLYAGRFLAMSAHIWIHERKYINSTVCSFVPNLEPEISNVNKVAFLTHIIDKTTLRSVDPMFDSLDDEDIKHFSSRIAPLLKGYPYHRQTIHAKNDKKIQLTLWGATVDSRFFEKSLRAGSLDAYKIVRQMAISARNSGATHLGLGQFTSIVTNSGTSLSDIGIPITTGNSLTVGSSFAAIKDRTMSRVSVIKRHFNCMRIGVVGAAGNIGTVMAQLAADIATELLVVHREGVHKSDKFHKLLKDLSLQVPNKKVIADDKLDLLHTCDAVILCVNSTGTLINARHIKHGAIVLDVSIPSVVGRDVTSRNDVTVVYGGTMKLPLGQKMNHPGFNKFNNEIFACMAETIITGLTDERSSFSIGPIAKAKVIKSIELADLLGFEFGRSSYMGSR